MVATTEVSIDNVCPIMNFVFQLYVPDQLSRTWAVFSVFNLLNAADNDIVRSGKTVWERVANEKRPEESRQLEPRRRI
jgi:hypothetical protein